MLLDPTSLPALKEPIEIVECLTQGNALNPDLDKPIWESLSAIRSESKPLMWGSSYERITIKTTGIDFNRTETAPVAPSQMEQWVGVLRTEMQQFQERSETEMARLSLAVEQLTLAVSAIQSAYVEDEDWRGSRKLTLFDAGIALELPDGELATALNYLADDNDTWNPQWEEVALSKVDSSNPRLRAASARAIAAHNRALAESVLTARLLEEKNKFVGSIIKSALEAARA